MLNKFTVKTKEREELVNISSQVAAAVKGSGVKNGICVVHIPHTTAAVTINENADPDVQRDITSFMKKMVPQSATFRHSEGNSDSHIKSSLFSCSQTIIIDGGNLLLGTWQGIYFCEFDGPRDRTVIVKIMEG